MRFKFKYIFAFALLGVLSLALFIFRGQTEMANLIIGALVAAFGTVSAYFYTKDQDKDKNE